MRKTQGNFVKGAALLGGIGLITKFIGAVYTIACTYIVGTHGMSYYTTAFPVYTLLLAISSAGLPVAISKMVSERVTLGDYKAAHKVFRTAITAMIIIGLITTVIMITLSRQIATALGRPDASLAIQAIAPSLLFVAVISAYRGYFQGMQRMSPTAVSQIIEQVAKVGGLVLAYIWITKGEIYGAAGAVLGITFSEVIALLYLVILYRKKLSDFRQKAKSDSHKSLTKNIGLKLMYLSTPVIIGACALPIVQLADTAIITNTLNSMKSILLFGKEVMINQKTVDSLFSLLTAYVNPIINMPAVLSLALATSLVPSISASRAMRNELGVSTKSGIGLKLSMLIGLPCAVGIYLLSTPVVHLLYWRLHGEDLIIAGDLLGIMAFAVFFLTILQTMTGILQGLGKTYLPVINLFIGIGVKILTSIIFIRMPEVNILGAAYGTLVCYAIAALLDVVCVIRYAKAKIKIVDNFIRPLLAALSMGLFVYLLMPKVTSGGYSRLMTGVVIVIAALLYIFFILFFGALNKEDMKYIPGGKLITSLMIKLKIWRVSYSYKK